MINKEKKCRKYVLGAGFFRDVVCKLFYVVSADGAGKSLRRGYKAKMRRKDRIYSFECCWGVLLNKRVLGKFVKRDVFITSHFTGHAQYALSNLIQQDFIGAAGNAHSRRPDIRLLYLFRNVVIRGGG